MADERLPYSGPIVSAREAFDAGLKRYFTGKPCGNGHVAERMISNGSCAQCLNERRTLSRHDAYERVKIWRLNNPGARTAEAQAYRQRHPDKVKATAKRYYDNHPEERRANTREWRRRMRAINPEGEKERLRRWAQRREEKRAKEAGRPRPDICDVCRERGTIVFDHCHAKGHFRGWLCSRCNLLLGHVKDDPALLRGLADYLESANGETNRSAA